MQFLICRLRLVYGDLLNADLQKQDWKMDSVANHVRSVETDGNDNTEKSKFARESMRKYQSKSSRLMSKLR